MSLEGEHHLVGELLGLGEEDAVSREVKCGEEAAEDADDRLEHAHLHAHREVMGDGGRWGGDRRGCG